ncbi:MAG: amidohydrolase [Oscillospiraceae bacterium]|jgi:predicted TIM-barrel fold metal-dependent hydrolase|nr:amidohydrolase [Oscillospiraceae bacterium]
MRRRIIDFHTHLGDIFHGNQNITFKAPRVYPPFPDPFEALSRDRYCRPLIAEDQAAQNVLIDAGQKRVWALGGLASTSQMLTGCGVDFAVSLPVLPNTSFEEALAASKLEPRLIPFTSADFTLPTAQMQEKLIQDIRLGARGLKLHPILQNVPLTDPRTFAAVEVFGQRGMPITAHCGINDYYKPDSPYRHLAPKEYGELSHMLSLIARYPDYILIPAHAGGDCGWEYESLAEAIHKHGWRNVYTDTSFKNAAVMRELATLFGADRLLFASDYPFDGVARSIEECEKAFVDQPDVADMVFCQNAARILRLDD